MNGIHVAGFLGHFGPWEIILVLAIVLLLFGAGRIPEVARSLGRGVNEFKRGLKGDGPEGGGDRREVEGRVKV